MKQGAPMLAASRLYSFLDHVNGFNIHFLEGQKIIHDLMLLHPMEGSGFAYFRDTFLGLMPMIFFLKPGEMIGIYVDSDDPYFRLKIETDSSGHTRTLLFPEAFNLFPMQITGKVRVTKVFPGNKSPYTSVLDLNATTPKEVINKILEGTYQTNSEVMVSEISDQSIMVTKLPPARVDVVTDDSIKRKDYIKRHHSFFHDVFEAAANDIEKIVKLFEDRGFSYLSSRQVSFYCPCSHDRMVVNIRGLAGEKMEDLFDPGKETLEVKCDYCRKTYEISRAEVLGS
jgi:molecular chaperone Hsp33